jgi:VWFA-related protein
MMPWTMRRIFGLCVLLEAAIRGQTPAAQLPTFRADTHLVQVTVVVQDGRSNAVTDLAAGDFRVCEDGKERAISLFSADSGPAANVAPNVAAGAAVVSNQVPTTAGVTGILFDRLNTAWSDQGEAKQNIIKFLSQVAPTERIGSYVLDSSSVSIVHDFTSDTRSLLRAVGRVQG